MKYKLFKDIFKSTYIYRGLTIRKERMCRSSLIKKNGVWVVFEAGGQIEKFKRLKDAVTYIANLTDNNF